MSIHAARWVIFPNGPAFGGRVEWLFAPSLLSNMLFVDSTTGAVRGQLWVEGAQMWRTYFRSHPGLMPYEEGYWFDPPLEILKREILHAASCTDEHDYSMSLVQQNWKYKHDPSILHTRRESASLWSERDGKNPLPPDTSPPSDSIHSLH